MKETILENKFKIRYYNKVTYHSISPLRNRFQYISSKKISLGNEIVSLVQLEKPPLLQQSIKL